MVKHCLLVLALAAAHSAAAAGAGAAGTAASRPGAHAAPDKYQMWRTAAAAALSARADANFSFEQA